jgi:putative NADPH-quinone reductase
VPKIRIVYVTRTGHARALAEEVAKLTGATPARIVDKVDRGGFIGYIKTARQAARSLATPIEDPNVDLAAADVVVLVQPVWAWSITPPMRSWLQAHKAELVGKKLGFLATNGGSPGEPLKRKFEKEFGKLTAFAVIHQGDREAKRSNAIAAFVAALKQFA